MPFQNTYAHRALPNIIGTVEFENNDFAGLQDLSDHEDEEDAIIGSDTGSIGRPDVSSTPQPVVLRNDSNTTCLRVVRSLRTMLLEHQAFLRHHLPPHPRPRHN